ncbi:LysR family transcriptional regulator [Neisseria perflava]|uniref:LysR family transcriptional regulator n=1 Tax=Neisseria perflava TaxID=33053 RepID=UPI00209EB482|nr:LysR family transcriptional regulator [Neisseria perflava]MCP1659429.1 DNA-binding transcriptional LysR family regulator [Neisseria perflava]MCP1772269.1 DNA-binding transcriptional LysR family regulator [Neisseria perflava]
MYTLDQLHAFVCVCESGSISAAARRLGKAQSAVSQSIANLEIALDQTLFDRSGGAATLTQTGAAVLAMVKVLLAQNTLFEQRVAALSRHEESGLIVAFEDSLWTDPVGAVFARLQSRFPHTKLDIRLSEAEDIARGLSDGSIHIGISYHVQPQPPYRATHLGSQAFVAVASREHPLAGQQNITQDELADHCQLLHATKDTPVLSPKVWLANGYYLMLDMVAYTLGWAILPHSLLGDDIWDNIVALDLAEPLLPAPKAITALTAPSYTAGAVTAFLLTELAEVFGDKKAV